MTPATLRIRNTNSPQRPAVAWFVPGDDPQRWLERICAAGLGIPDLRLWIVPRAQDDRHPLGVLAVRPGSVSRTAIQALTDGPGAAYGCIGRLYLPVEAMLLPDVSTVELDSLLAEGGRSCVWVPGVGLVGFDPDDELRVSDLLARPVARTADWSRAQPGIAFARRLLAVEPDVAPTVEIILEQGRDDIGSHSDSLDQLPPAPAEPSPGVLGNISRQGRRAMARAVQWLTDRVPADSAVPTWMNSLAGWARRQLEAVSSAIEAARNREVQRLLHLLESNPDEGLRYAIPFDASNRRGQGPPGDRLTRRDADFNLARLAGGGPADRWDIAAEYQQQLAAAYRAAAVRELRLGRYRRAAYIYAELLADLEAAAAALKTGRHFREAAVLYRDRLQRPREAAECLVQGGLLSEAIALYEELQDFERAGDLHAELDQPDQARDAWRRAVDQRRAAGDDRAAAALLENKLHQPDEALESLEAGWRASRQPRECLDELFRLLARLGRHDAAVLRVSSLRAAALAGDRYLVTSESLVQAVGKYPDDRVRATAADATRVIAAHWLRTCVPAVRRQFVGLLTQLAPEDRLLERDGQRYLQHTADQDRRRSSPTSAPARRAESLRLVETIRLLPGIAWQRAASAGEVFYAVGYDQQSPDRLLLARGIWSKPGSTPTVVSWRINAVSQPPVLLAADPLDRHPVLVHVPGQAPLAWRLLPPTWSVAAGQRAGSPEWIPRPVLALARGEHGHAWTLDWAGERYCEIRAAGAQASAPTLHLVRLAQEHQPDVVVDWPREDLPALQPPLVARHDRVYFALGDCLYRYQTGHESADQVVLPGPVRTLVGSHAHTRLRLVAGLDRGAALWFEDRSLHDVTRFAVDVERPVCGFTWDGSLIVAGDGLCQLYRTVVRQVCFGTELSGTGPAPIAVLTASAPNRFALVAADGTVRVYESVR